MKDHNKEYEYLAKKFYDEHGFFPPGKDTYDHKPDNALELWNKFLDKENGRSLNNG